jgi:cobalamin biosynthesis protein CobT
MGESIVNKEINMTLNSKEKKAIYYSMTMMAEGKLFSLKKKRCSVADTNNGVGYTVYSKDDKKIQIFIASENELYDGLTKTEHLAAMKGICVHEILHQLMTPFASMEKFVEKLEGYEKPIFSFFSNLLEDPAIEFFAPEYFGGTALNCLRFIIKHTYDVSPEINKIEDAFGQYSAALVQFGDLGFLKGNFTFPEAEEAWKKTCKIFLNAVEERDGVKRLEAALEIMNLTRPLWEEMAKKQEEQAKKAEANMKRAMDQAQKDFEEMLKKLLEQLGKNDMSGMSELGDGDKPEGEGDKDSAKSKNRKVTVRKVSKELYDELKKHSSELSGKDDGGDIVVIQCDEDSEEGEENSSGQSSQSSGESDNEGEASQSQSGNKNGENDADANASNNSDGDSEANDGKDGKDSSSKTQKSAYDSKSKSKGQHTDQDVKIENQAAPEGYDDGETGFSEITNEDYSLSDEDMAHIDSELKRTEKAIERAERESSADDTPLDNSPIEAPRLGKRSCVNKRVHPGDTDSVREEYQRISSSVKPVVSALTYQLKRIFVEDKGNKTYQSRGKLSVKRVGSKPYSPNVFMKRNSPSNKADTIAMILVDESGSMWCQNRYVAARDCCIALSEAFSNLGIPLYVIGFTADTDGADVVHRHYITWRNSKADRLSLSSIQARANNLDGYSIRYGHQLLKKKSAHHKLMIVISDGQPAAHAYYDGVADTAEAIRQARKDASVLGVAVGNDSTDTLFKMYGKDFLHVSEPSDLTKSLSNKVKQIVKAWK